MLPKIAFGHKKTAFSQAPKPQTAFLRSQPDSAHRFFSSLLEQHQQGAVSQVQSTLDQPDDLFLAEDHGQLLRCSHER